METINIITQAIRTSGVLATIVRVDGSAYRKPGTMMLFTETGHQVGFISASCLEADLKMRAEQLLSNRECFSDIVVYDMSREDDLGWGRGAGCNGKVHVLLEEIDKRLIKDLKTLLAYLHEKVPVTMNKLLSSVPNKVSTTYYPQNAASFGDISNDSLNQSLYVQHFYPQERLIIFGAGFDAIPLIELAQMIGFETYIWDWRPNLLNKKRLRQANYFTDMKAMTYYPSDYVVVMTHDFQHDQKIVQQLLLKQPFKYVGVLGPKKRMQRLLNKTNIPPWIHSPIGMDIKAEGPEQIGISIIAEIIKVKNKELYREQESYRYLFSGRKKYKV